MRVVAITILAIGLGACSGGRAIQAGPQTFIPTAGENAPQRMLPSASYRLGPLDELRIDVFQETELSVQELPIRPDGTINLPLVGQIPAAGKTADALAGEIGERLRRYLREPRVAVNVTKYTSQKVTVQGAVNQAGVFEVPGGLSLIDAVALAQGTNDYARLNEVVVFRTEDGRRYAARFDLGAIQAGQAADPEIRAGDVVVVGFSEARQRFRDALAVLPIAAGIFVALIR